MNDGELIDAAGNPKRRNWSPEIWALLGLLILVLSVREIDWVFLQDIARRGALVAVGCFVLAFFAWRRRRFEEE